MIGPEIFLWYFPSCAGVQIHALLLPKFPHGHGFIAAIKMKLAGNLAEPLDLVIEITLSSKGCLKDSKTLLSNSGNSSRKRTPLWARVISPGRGKAPPPTRAT